jgi:hypothetical protein
MAKPHSDSTHQATNNAPKGAAKAFKPSKKARTNLAAIAADKGAAISPRPASSKKKEGTPSGSNGDPAHGNASEAAFGRVLADIEALPVEQLRRINVYVPAAVAVALGVLPKLMGLRDVLRALPGLAASFDKLEDYALAALYAHARTLPYGEAETQLRVLVNEAGPLRERLLLSAETLVHFGLFDETHVAAIRRGSGYLNTAQDLAALALLYRASWGTIASKTPVTLPEIERAAQLGPLLVVALGRRQQGTDGVSSPSEAYDQLTRAYTLFFNAYDDCRCGVGFVRRREGDADDFAPALKQTQRRQRNPSGGEAGDDESPDTGNETPGSDPPDNGTPGGMPGSLSPNAGVVGEVNEG